MLGLLAPVITNSITRQRRKVEIESTAKIELGELKTRLAAVAHTTFLRFGGFNRELIVFLLPIFLESTSDRSTGAIVATLQTLDSGTDEEIEAFVKEAQSQAESGQIFQKYELLYLQNRVGELSMFSEEKQRCAMEVLTQLRIFNEQVETSKWYFKLSYDSTLDTMNHRQVVSNSQVSNIHIAERAVEIIRCIDRYLGVSR